MFINFKKMSNILLDCLLLVSLFAATQVYGYYGDQPKGAFVVPVSGPDELEPEIRSEKEQAAAVIRQAEETIRKARYTIFAQEEILENVKESLNSSENSLRIFESAIAENSTDELRAGKSRMEDDISTLKSLRVRTEERIEKAKQDILTATQLILRVRENPRVVLDELKADELKKGEIEPPPPVKFMRAKREISIAEYTIRAQQDNLKDIEQQLTQNEPDKIALAALQERKERAKKKIEEAEKRKQTAEQEMELYAKLMKEVYN